MCRAICINDKERPKEIPVEKWIKENEEYTIIWVYYSIPSKTMAFELAEITLDETCTPYSSFSAKRFAIHKDDLEEFLQLMKDCTEFNDVDVNELINQEIETYAL
jgi:hypothetical protein